MNSQISPPPAIFNSPSTWAGSLNISNYDVIILQKKIINNAEVEIKARKEIVLLPNTGLVNFSSTGNFHAVIEKGYLDIVSFHPNGWSGIPKYEKFELGVALPLEYDQLIEDFLSGVNPTHSINPYDPDKVLIKATFQKGFTGSIYERFGFYYREIQPTGSTYNQSKSTYPFRIRFAPPYNGLWYFNIELSINGVSLGVYNMGQFNCVDTGKPGPISIGNHNRFRYEATGNTFFPIGQDFGPLNHDEGPSACGSHTQLTDLTDYIGHINNLANNGGNFIRVPMDKTNFYLEFEEPRVYGSNRKPSENFLRQYCAWSLDKVFETLENRNIYCFLLTETDQFFQNGGYPCNTLTGVEWPNHPYASLTEYGVSSPIDMFSNPDVFKIYKKRLFYIQARYGYSPSLGAYEVCNEINAIGKGYTNSYVNSSITRTKVYDWAVNVADYYKSFYPSHMTTISYAGSGSFTDPSNTINPTGNTSFDIRSPHDYGLSNSTALSRFAIVQSQLYSTGNAILPNCVVKPVLFGEMGMTDDSEGDKCTEVEFHNGMWASGCSGSAGAGLYRYDYKNDIKRDNHMPALSVFFSNMPFATDDFIPSEASNSILSPKVTALYNVTNSGHKAYGWMFNRSFYWPNDPNLIIPCVNNYHSFAIGTASAVYEEIKLDGFQHAKKYIIEYWYAYGTGGVYDSEEKTSTLFGGKLKIKKNLGECIGCTFHPDYGLKIYKKGSSYKTLNEDPYANKDKGDIYLNNDTILIQTDNYAVGGQFDTTITFHHWDLGNGIISDEQFPSFQFSNSGTFPLIYSTLNSFGDTVHYHQNITIIKNDNPIIGVKINLSLTIELIPNPSNGLFTIYNPNNLQIRYVNIYDSKGALILKTGGEFKVIDLSNFNDGLYSIVIFTNNGIFTKKLVKQE